VTVTPVESAQTVKRVSGWEVLPLVQAPVVSLKLALWHGQWNEDPVKVTVQHWCGHEAENARYCPPPFEMTMMSGCWHCGSE
jgi:hypothetical protein